MSVDKEQGCFGFSKKELCQFRLCVDRYDDDGKRLYRLYCPYVVGYWAFDTLSAMAHSLLETKTAIRSGQPAEDIFSPLRGLHPMNLKYSPSIWTDSNMLHTKRGSFYSAYILFSPNEERMDDGVITFIDRESHRSQHNEAFHTAEALTAILTDIEAIFASAHNMQEQCKLFRQYRSKNAGKHRDSSRCD